MTVVVALQGPTLVVWTMGADAVVAVRLQVLRRRARMVVDTRSTLRLGCGCRQVRGAGGVGDQLLEAGDVDLAVSERSQHRRDQDDEEPSRSGMSLLQSPLRALLRRLRWGEVLPFLYDRVRWDLGLVASRPWGVLPRL